MDHSRWWILGVAYGYDFETKVQLFLWMGKKSPWRKNSQISLHSEDDANRFRWCLGRSPSRVPPSRMYSGPDLLYWSSQTSAVHYLVEKATNVKELWLVFYHINAPAHSALRTGKFLAKHRIEGSMIHLLYSPYLTPKTSSHSPIWKDLWKEEDLRFSILRQIHRRRWRTSQKNCSRTETKSGITIGINVCVRMGSTWKKTQSWNFEIKQILFYDFSLFIF